MRVTRADLAVYFLAGGLAVATAVGVTLGVSQLSESQRVRTAQGGCPGSTLCNEAAALEKATGEFPSGHNPHNGIARLVTLQQALTWQSAQLLPGDPSNAKPVWLVAILGDNLHVSDYAPPGTTNATNDNEIAGVWSVWDSSGSGLHAMGGLGLGLADPLTYSSIYNMTSLPLPIYTATPDPTATPGPTPTYGMPPD